MVAETEPRKFSHLSLEQVRDQNIEAFEFLSGLLGDKEEKVVRIMPHIALVRTSKDLIKISFDSLPLDRMAESPPKAKIEKETYFVSSSGLQSVDLHGVARLQSGLLYEVRVRHRVDAPNDAKENFFLPEGEQSLKTAAALMAETIRGWTENS